MKPLQKVTKWFGHSPGHMALSAYGLMQFNDMKTVCNYVDDKMIQRTANWLLDSRDGNGGFKRSAYKTYFGSNDNDIFNSYLFMH
ncbi:MAG: hypothetical protein HC831_19690 [Chloroflexia bacterium]|nr:hypothetical protein [Chloroflexia bacterium]